MPQIRRDEAGIAAHIAAPLVSALATLHLLGVQHRNIKPENVFLARFHLMLGDFDHAVRASSGPVSRVGTLPFMAPEVLLHDVSDPSRLRATVPAPDRKPYGPKADVFALGVLLYECLKHALPFHGDTEQELVADMLREGSPCLSGLRCAAAKDGFDRGVFLASSCLCPLSHGKHSPTRAASCARGLWLHPPLHCVVPAALLPRTSSSTASSRTLPSDPLR